MTTDAKLDARSLFGRALEIDDPERRVAFLQETAPSPAILAEVIELLALHEEATSFLRRPAILRRDITVNYEPLSEGPGSRVGPYKLLQEIGEGGMGTVFMAEQEEPVRRKVALKIIKPGMDSKQVVARFEAERQALSMMDHPNIAKVLDAGTTASGRPYFVMELVHGVPITEFCDANKLTPQERLALFIPVCQAIQHAHMKGIIHRDVKPSNVLVTMYDDKPVPKVIDFGVAKAVEQRLTEKTLFTQYGTLVGTFEYMSPEQAEMNAFGVDTRSDVYSLGVLLYELLTGSTPLERGRLRTAALGEVVRLIREEEPPRPSQRLSASGILAKVAAARKTDPGKLPALVRGELDWIVMRCLEKDRTRRYESATGLAKDVERYLAGDAVEACPPTLGYRLRKAYRRNRAAVLVASGFIGIVFGAAVLGGLLAVQARRAEQIAERNAEEALIARNAEVERRDEAERLGAELRLANYQASIRLAAASIERGEVGVARELLDRTRPRPGEADLRGFEWHYLRRQLNSESTTILETSPEFAPRDCTYSPDGRYLAIGCYGNNNGEESTTMQLWDLAEKRSRWTVHVRGRLSGNLVFTPDGNLLAFSTRPNDIPLDGTASEVWVIDVKKAEARKLLRFEAEYVYATVISPDGKHLAVFSKGGFRKPGPPVSRITTYELATGKVVSTTPAPEGTSDGHLGYDAAGRLLAVWEKEGTVSLWDCDNGIQRAVIDLKPTAANIQDVRLSRHGTSLIVGTSDKKVRAWDLSGDKPTLQSMFEVDAIGPSTQLHLSFDGKHASISDSISTPVVSIWDLRTGRRVLSGRGHTKSVDGIGFSPDGRSVASASMDGSVKLWLLTADTGPKSDLIAMRRFRQAQLPLARMVAFLPSPPKKLAEVWIPTSTL